MVIMTIKDFEMLVNVADAKAKFSSLLALVGLGKEEVIISKRDKPTAVLISYEKFLKMKKRDEAVIDRKALETLPSSVDQFVGIVSEEEADNDYKASREAYLREKYL